MIDVAGFVGESFDELRISRLDASHTPSDIGSASTLSIGQQWRFRIISRVVCAADEAAEVISLWNKIPDGDEARCHDPGFALELLLGGETVFVAALCWRCNNASIGGRLASAEWRRFDASSYEAQRLLKLCKALSRFSEPPL